MEKKEILIKDESGSIINDTLTKEWAIYFEAEEELKIIKEELIMKSLRAKAKKQKILGVIIKKGGTKSSAKEYPAIFEMRGWVIPKKKVNDTKAMKERLIKEGAFIPYIETSPSAYKKKPKKKKY